MKGDKRHILIMSSWYPTRKDVFLGNFVERFAEGLSQQHRVTVLHLQSDENCTQVEITEVNTDNLCTIIIYYPKQKKPWKKLKIQGQLLKEGFQLIHSVDLIFGHVLLPRVNQFVLAKKYFQCPLMVLEHGSYFRPSYPLGFLRKIWLKYHTRKVDQLLACSPLLKKDLARFFADKDIEVLPNSLDESHFQLRDNPVGKEQFIHISTLDSNTKHPDLLLYALYLLLKTYPEIHFTIVSNQPTIVLEKLARELAIEKAVSFKGPLNSNEIGDLLRVHDALLLCSSYETFGIVLAESWLCGTPVISTKVGIAYDLSPELGISIEKSSVEAVIESWKLFMESSVQWNPQLIRNEAMKYTKELVLKELNQKMNALIHQK